MLPTGCSKGEGERDLWRLPRMLCVCACVCALLPPIWWCVGVAWGVSNVCPAGGVLRLLLSCGWAEGCADECAQLSVLCVGWVCGWVYGCVGALLSALCVGCRALKGEEGRERLREGGAWWG